MSAPSLEYQNAKYLNFGFLAAKAEKASQALTENRSLTTEEISVLKNGSEFLKQVATGAKALYSGDYQVQNLKGAMEAFEFVMDPLEQLGAVLNGTDIAKALNDAAETVVKLGNEGTQNISEVQQKQVELFRIFYDQFYTFIRAQMTQMNKESLLGDKLRFESLNPRYH